MSIPQVPDIPLLESWLNEAGVEFHQCDRCEGLHINLLEEMEGVVDSRLFLEPYGLLFTTELEIRPAALLPITADLTRLNMDYPILKLFVDVPDEAVPQLVMAGIQLTIAGMSQQQFAHAMAAYIEIKRQLIEECRHLEYVFVQGDELSHEPPNTVH